MRKHTHIWNYVSSKKGVHVTRECRCGRIKETTIRGVAYFNRMGRLDGSHHASVPEMDELNVELNADMMQPRGLRVPPGMPLTLEYNEEEEQ